MDKNKRDRAKWVQLGLIISLVIVVAVLAVVIFQMQARLDTLSSPKDHAGLTQRLPSDAATAKPNPSDTQPSDKGDDWFSGRFDPNTWNPFAEMQRMQGHIDQLFHNSFDRFGKSQRFSDLVQDPEFSPKVDVQEDGNKFVIEVDLPGVDAGNVDVKVDGRDVTISGKRDNSVAKKDKDGHVVQQERRIGTFARTIELPEAVNADKMTAKNDNGVFTIVLPKA